MSALVQDLEAALGSADTAVVLSAAWETFDVVGRVADSVTWAPDSDELQALAAAQACFAGRSLLPLPGAGRPANGPRAGTESLSPYIDLLMRAQGALSQLADEEVSVEGRSVLREAAEHAKAGAATLAAVRQAP